MNAHRSNTKLHVLCTKVGVSCLLGLPILLFATAALARPAVAVLPFNNGDAARDVIIQKLERRYDIVPGQEVIAASESMGISMSRGANLARLARHVGVVAIIGGAVQGGRLTLAVYSGKNGQPVATGAVPFRGRFNRNTLRRTMRLIMKGLKRCPRRMPRPHRAQPEPEEPTMSFEPEGGMGEEEMPEGLAEENPLASSTPNPADPGGATAAPTAEVADTPREPREPGAPWIEGLFGVGVLSKSFELVDTENPNDRHPRYSSGAAFAINLTAKAIPAAFFTDHPAARFFARLRFQQTVGLQSKTASGDTATESTSNGTTIREVLLDAGYDWKILSDKLISPHLELGIGYGLSDFSIDWGDISGSDITMPGFAYRFLFFGASAWWNFLPQDWGLLGGHLSFDYRLVSEAGEITEDIPWYGEASTGGVAFGGGADVTLSNVLIRLDYTYTRYFYTFNGDPIARGQHLDQRGAAGALDQYHSVTVSAGYSY